MLGYVRFKLIIPYVVTTLGIIPKICNPNYSSCGFWHYSPLFFGVNIFDVGTPSQMKDEMGLLGKQVKVVKRCLHAQTELYLFIENEIG